MRTYYAREDGRTGFADTPEECANFEALGYHKHTQVQLTGNQRIEADGAFGGTDPIRKRTEIRQEI